MPGLSPTIVRLDAMSIRDFFGEILGMSHKNGRFIGLLKNLKLKIISGEKGEKVYGHTLF